MFGFYLKILTIDASKSSVNSQPRLPFLKPKPSTGSAFCPVKSSPMTADSNIPPTESAQSIVHTLNHCKQTLSASISTQMLIESSQKERSESPIQKYNYSDTNNSEVPHEIRSLLPPNNNIRSISPTHLVIFPPEIPPEFRAHCRSKTSTPQPLHEINVKTKSECIISSDIHSVESSVSKTTVEYLEIVEPNYDQNINEYEVSKSEKSDMNVREDQQTPQSTVEFLNEVEQNYIPRFDQHVDSKFENSDIIQNQQISYIINAEPKIKSRITTPVVEDNRAESPLVTALTTAPDRSYSPLPSFVDASEFVPKRSEPIEEQKLMTMADALAVAPDRSYKLPESKVPTRPVGNNPVKYMHGYNKKEPAIPLLMTRSLIYSPMSAVDSEEEKIAILGLKSFPPVSDELKLSTAAGDFDRNESDFEYVEESVFEVPKTEETEESTNEETVEEEQSKPLPKHPFTASGLHEPSDIPRYQQSIPENPHRATTPGEKYSGKLISPGIQSKVSTFTPKTSFLKQEPNINTKVVTLGFEPSSLEGCTSKFNNADPNIITTSHFESVSTNNTSISKISLTTSVPTSTPLLPTISVTNVTAVEPVDPMPKTSLPASLLSKKLTCFTKKQQPKLIPTPIPQPNIGGQPTGRTGASAGLTAPKRGRGVLNPQNLTPGARVPLCGQCNLYIR